MARQRPCPEFTTHTARRRVKQGKLRSGDGLAATECQRQSGRDRTVSTRLNATIKQPKVASRRRAHPSKLGQEQLITSPPPDDILPHDLFGSGTDAAQDTVCVLPWRHHSLAYHRPLLLSSHRQQAAEDRQSLLRWYDSVSANRAMPWRKPWVNPALITNPAVLREALKQRAYEVWISEVMLQQTRVSVVIDYWNSWMRTWPTLDDLARAKPEEVLAAWRGLGYYSRAARIHDAAKLVVRDPDLNGLLPASAAELQARIPGVGRYTAGAISAIVFGHAEPMVDGNVMRVLSRQMGIYGDAKSNNSVEKMIWSAADALVKAVSFLDVNNTAFTAQRTDLSDRPGLWGQALMELGSTICNSKPNCAACPIKRSCRVYHEGVAPSRAAAGMLRDNDSAAADVEDLCHLCEPFEIDHEGEEPKGDEDGEKPPDSESIEQEAREVMASGMRLRPRQLVPVDDSASFSTRRSRRQIGKPASLPNVHTEAAAEAAAEYARRFPYRRPKRPVREEETIVCLIGRQDASFLIQRRPLKGLLAGLWEFPNVKSNNGTESQRTEVATLYVSELLGAKERMEEPGFSHIAELGTVPWLFSHLKLKMHVHLFQFRGPKMLSASGALSRPWKWTTAVDTESMGTGMRKCWSLARTATR